MQAREQNFLFSKILAFVAYNIKTIIEVEILYQAFLRQTLCEI